MSLLCILSLNLANETLTAIVNAAFLIIGGLVTISGSIWGVRRLQRMEWWERIQPALDTRMEFQTLPFTASNGRPAAILEISIWLKNLSADSWMVPGVYLSARSMPCDRAREVPCHGVEHQFDRLPSMGELSEPKNIAFLERSIYQVSPNEAEQFVCWILLDETAIKQNPVLMIRADVFLAPHLRIGFRHGRKRKPGKERDAWIELMRAHEYCGRRQIPFHRTPVAMPEFSIRAHDWVLLNPGAIPSGPGGMLSKYDVDAVNTRRLRKVLRSFWTLSRERAVDVAALRGRRASVAEKTTRPLPHTQVRAAHDGPQTRH